MIVPTARLIVCYAVVIPFFTLLPVIGVGETGVAAFVVAMLLVIALGDGVSARLRLLGISLTMPAVIRVVKDRQAVLDIHLHNTSLRKRTVSLAFTFPSAVKVSSESLLIELPEGESLSTVSWPIVPLQRGLFHIDTCSIEVQSFLGFWQWRKRGDISCQIHIYPGMSQDRALLAAMFLNRSGLFIQRRRVHGKGKEFERLKDYAVGDGYEDIHWKTTAKRRHPVSKVYQIERTQEIYVIIDSSRLSARLVPDTGENQLDRFITAGLLLGIAAMKQGDLFGVGAFSDSVHHFMGASGGKTHFNNCRRHIFSLLPKIVNPDYDELFTFIRTRLRKRALLIVLTSLDDPVMAESFVRGVELVCRHHIVLAAMFQPERGYPLFQQSLKGDEDVYDALSGHQAWHNLKEVRGVLAKRGVDFALFPEARFAVNLISKYMAVKERQSL